MKDGTPRHIGFIMDGNGRWAKSRNLPRTAGHLEGLKALKRVIPAAIDLGVEYVTFYAFSTENWKRPKSEVDYLMKLITKKLPGEIGYFREHGIRILGLGDIDGLPEEAAQAVRRTERETADMSRITCQIAVNYGGQNEICRAVDRIIEKRLNSPITADIIRENMYLSEIPPVDIIVRSAGENRISNFLLWDAAYAEFAFYEKLWPDWDRTDVEQVCLDYSRRTRKFGGLIK